MAFLEIKEIRKALGPRLVLNGVSFSIDKGEACAVIGPSGEGKTTLLKCINLLTPIDYGEIKIGGEIVISSHTGPDSINVEIDPSELRQKIGMVFQEWNLWPNMTIRQNITFALRYVLKLSKDEAEARAAELANRVRIGDKLDDYPHRLSGGQKQRAGIARALAMNPDVLMLDEVTSALDPVLAAEVLDVMTELKSEGRTLLLVTHHIEFARSVADKVIFLHGAKVCEAGPPSILTDPQTEELRWFLKQVQRAH